MKPIQRFWSLLNLDKKEISQIYIYAVLNGLVNLSLPLGIQTIINFIQMGEVSTSWVLLVSIVLVGIAVGGGLQILQLRIVENIQQKIFARSAFEFAYRIPKIRMLKLDNIFMPELVNRFFDTVTIQKGMPKILIDFSLATFTVVFGLILLTLYSPFFIALGVLLFLMLWLIFLLTGKKGLDTSIKESKYKYKMAHWLEEVARTHSVFRMSTTSHLHLNKTDDIVSKYIEARQGHFSVLVGQFRYFVLFKVILAAGLLLLGGFLVFQQEMNIGQFVAAEIIILLIINSVEKVIQTIETIYDVLTGLDKIGFVTDLDLEKDGTSELIDTENGLHYRLEDVSFRFNENDTYILNQINLELKSGSRSLLVGKTGSGKSVLMHLLAGLLSAEMGEVLVNDIPINHYKKRSLYERIGYCLNKNQIFLGSIRENITMGRKIEEGYLHEVLEVLCLNSFLNKLSNGIDTNIDPEGRRLPRSIIQKIQLARALAHKPSLLLIEEAIYALSDEEVEKIIDFVMGEDKKWTVVVIGNHPKWKDYCHQTIQL